MIEISKEEFRQLSEYIKQNYGIHLKEEKRILVMGRLQHVLQKTGCKSFTEYFAYLTADKSGRAVITMIDKITTNHTFFMREVEHFDYFRDHVLPELKKNVKDKDLRIWCAASSTGEEPYTLAILLDESFASEKLWWDTRILATDISESALEDAIKGVYSNERIQSLPAHWIVNYFQRYDNENWEVKSNIKNAVFFRKFNLMETVFPFKKKFHVIFCRNVMIYFDNETKSRLIKRFYEILEPGGYLFVGHSESIGQMEPRFRYVIPSVYKKMDDTNKMGLYDR